MLRSGSWCRWSKSTGSGAKETPRTTGAAGLQARAVRILRRHRDQPVTVFCHLLLCALELHRLRQGLLQRALFNDLVSEAAA